MINEAATAAGPGVAQRRKLTARMRPTASFQNHASGQMAQAVAGMLARRQAVDPAFGGNGAAQFKSPPAPSARPQVAATQHHAAPRGPSPENFAAQRLAQLRQMGVDPSAALGQPGPGGPDDRSDPAALWRALSPIMGAIVQARAGLQPQQDLSKFPPAVAALVAKIVAESHARDQGPYIGTA